MLYPQVNSRRNLFPLTGLWRFALDPEDCGEENHWHEGLPSSRPIGVPGSWNEQYADTMFYNGSAWYETEFYVPAEWRGGFVRLRFGAAGYKSRIWLNSVPLGEHEGNSLPFEFDITRQARHGIRNRLTVRINNQLGPESIPPGGMEHISKKSNESDFMTEAISNFASVVPEIQMLPLLLEMRRQYPDVPFDFLPYAGIHRPVVLYATPKDRVEKIRVETEVKRTKAVIKCVVEAEGRATAVQAHLSQGGKEASRSGIFQTEAVLRDGKAAFELSIPRPDLWHPDSPRLYQLNISLLKNSKVIDEYQSEIGIRSIQVTEDRILLNGRSIYLKGVGKHEDFPILGKGLSEPVLVRDFSLMKWLGANSFRTSHYPYSEEHLTLADRLGFLVIDEMPAVGLNYNMYSGATLDKCKGILTELIERDNNHPSVIMWSIANEPDPFTESAGDFFGKLRAHAKQLDPSRPVTIAAVPSPKDYTFDVVDVICINRYYGWYTEPGQVDVAAGKLSYELDRIYEKYKKPVMVSEFGADSIAGLHSDPPEVFTEEYQTELLRAYIEVIRSKSFTVGEHIWNFADFKTPQNYTRTVFNRKGLFTRDRRPKLAAHVVRELWKAGGKI